MGEITLQGNNLNLQNNSHLITENGNITLNSNGNLSLNNSQINTNRGEITLSAQNLTLQNNTLVETNNSNITLTANEIDLQNNSQIKGNNTIQIQTLDPNLNITLGGSIQNQSLNLNQNDLNSLQNGFSQIIIGRLNYDSQGIITLENNLTFNDPVLITGGSTLIGNNSNLTWQITGNNQGNIANFSQGLTFQNIENLRGGNNNDTFLFYGNANLSGIINGGGGNNTLNYDNYGNAITVNLENKQATALNSFSNIQNFIGSNFSDTLIAENKTNIFNIIQDNTGTLNNITFKNIENLIGGNSNDSFNFSNNAILNGFIEGKEGINTLNYNLYNRGVNINLQNQTATGLTNFNSIQNFIGSSFNDSLTAQNQPNTITINQTNRG
jgi:hypothetical protein